MSRKSKEAIPKDILHLDISRLERELKATKRRAKMNDPPRRDGEVENGENGNGDPQPRKTMGDYQRPTMKANPSCIRLNERTRNYELKNSTLTLLPTFKGIGGEDALFFLREFANVIQSLPLQQGVTEDDLKLRCFPHCLKDQARAWFFNLEENSIDTWDKMEAEFMMKWYSADKTLEIKNKIVQFVQQSGESFHNAWERYNNLLNQCPHHGFTDYQLVQGFYDGLTIEDQKHVDNNSGGSASDKDPEELKEIFKRIASNSRRRIIRGKKAFVNEIASNDLNGQMDDLAKKVQVLINSSKATHEACNSCGMYGHTTAGCMNIMPEDQVEEVNYMGNYGNQGKIDPFSNTYNQGWRQHPNLSWRNQGSKPYVPPGFQGQQRPPLQQQNLQGNPPNFDKQFNEIKEMMNNFSNNINGKIDRNHNEFNAWKKTVESRFDQIFDHLNKREQGQLPSNVIVNPKVETKNVQNCSAIFTKENVPMEEQVTMMRQREENFWKFHKFGKPHLLNKE